MKMLKVMAAAATITGGVLKLTLEQAGRRQGVLELKSGAAKPKLVDHYIVTGTTQFKRGEVFGWDSYVPKTWGADLVDLEVAEKLESEGAAAVSQETDTGQIAALTAELADARDAAHTARNEASAYLYRAELAEQRVHLAIVAAIKAIDPTDAEAFVDGKPKIEVVSEVVGFEVSGDELERALAALTEAA